MNEQLPVPIPALLDGLRTLKDGTLKITFETQEISTEDKVKLMEGVNKLGFLFFQEKAYNKINVPDIPLEDFEKKTPSQRLRNVLFVLWEQGGSNGDFDVYYRAKMEKIISLVKDKLD